MSDRVARLRRWFERLFAERHIYLRSGGAMRAYVLSPRRQVLLAGGIVAAGLWMGVCTAAMLDQAIGPNVIKRLLAGLDAFLEQHAADGWTGVESFRGLRRDRILAQSEIRRPDAADYHSGYEVTEGYAPVSGER